jgi:hypothetical protein
MLSLVSTERVRCETAAPPMSQMGQTRPFGDLISMSGLTLQADLRASSQEVAEVPQAENGQPQGVGAT